MMSHLILHYVMLNWIQCLYPTQGLQPKRYSLPSDTMGPDMSTGVQGIFNFLYTRAGKNAHTTFVDNEDELQNSDDEPDRTAFLVNEKGSIHQSFTREDVS